MYVEFLGSPLFLTDQVITGFGFPLASHVRSTVVSSLASTSGDEPSKSIFGGTAEGGDTRSKISWHCGDKLCWDIAVCDGNSKPTKDIKFIVFEFDGYSIGSASVDTLVTFIHTSNDQIPAPAHVEQREPLIIYDPCLIVVQDVVLLIHPYYLQP